MSNKGEVISTNESSFIREALKEGIRVDGRSPLDVRVVKIDFGYDAGTVKVHVGRTCVVACVTADIIPPFPDRPTEGFLNFFVDFSPMASPHFEAGKPSDKSIELSRVIERGIRDSRAIDTEALVIVAGEKVWSIRCDIHVMDHDGNIGDCANLAAVTALLHVRRPDVTVMGDTVTIHSVEDRQPVPLSLHHIPICVTFGYMEDGSIIVDPSLKEELTQAGSMTITMNIHKEICSIQKAGGCELDTEVILKCANIAGIKVTELTKLVQQRLKDVEDNPNIRKQMKKMTPIDVFGPIVVKEHSVIASAAVGQITSKDKGMFGNEISKAMDAREADLFTGADKGTDSSDSDLDSEDDNIGKKQREELSSVVNALQQEMEEDDELSS